MSIMLIAHIQCDVCGNELDEQYPPQIIGKAFHEFDPEAMHDLENTARKDLSAKSWGYDPTSERTDAWGYRVTLRCHECRHARRWT